MDCATREENRVLIVEDDRDMRHQMSAALTANGFSVHATGNGAQALNLLRESAPDIVLTDVELPGMSGFDLCRWIRRQEHLRDTPVLMVSGLTGFHDKLRGYLAGARRYICKPFFMTDLLEQVTFFTESREGSFAEFRKIQGRRHA